MSITIRSSSLSTRPEYDRRVCSMMAGVPGVSGLFRGGVTRHDRVTGELALDQGSQQLDVDRLVDETVDPFARGHERLGGARCLVPGTHLAHPPCIPAPIVPPSSRCPAPRIAVEETPTRTKPLPEVLEFMQVLWRVVHGLEQRSKRMAVECGVTTPQRLVIRMVGLYPGISARELASLLQVHPSTVTGVLQRLQRQGLLARRVHPDDGRRALLTLTANGRRLDRLRKGTAEGAVGEALWRLSRRDRDCTRRALNLIAERVEHAVTLARAHTALA